MKFTESHEWIDLKNGQATVGVTEYAQKELGDIVFVELPKVGKQVKKGEAAAVLESTKAAADVYSPVSGTIAEVNTLLGDQSELVNQSPEMKGWLFKLSGINQAEYDGLLSVDQYQEILK
jgi:glycine cleavage system H protein